MSQEPPKPLKLHLGCGETYLEGYVNIDFPQSEHTTISIKADRYEDLRTLQYPEGTVDEVRHHHVFEHFDRAMALALLARWRRWLKVGGRIIIETPDFEGCVQDFLKSKSREVRGELIRHIFGSQEASWAIHYDGWYEDKYRFVLKKLGFEVSEIKRMRSNVSKKLGHNPFGLIDTAVRAVPKGIRDKLALNTLPNIQVTAKKLDQKIDEPAAIREILSTYLVGVEHDTKEILEVWMKEVRI